MTDIAPDEVYCTSCGAVLHETTAFCTECGAENDAAVPPGDTDAPPRDPPAEDRPPADDRPPAADRPPAGDPGRRPGGTPPGEPPRESPPPEGAPRDDPPAGEAPPPRESPPPGESPPREGPPPEGTARQPDRGAPPRGRDPAGQHAGGGVADWNVFSTDQLLGGLKGGVFASIVGLLVTVVLVVVTTLSSMEKLLNDNYDGRVGEKVEIGNVSIEGATGAILSFADAADSLATFVVKFFVWLFYSANFVPIVLQGGPQSRDVDLLAGLEPIGASPILVRIGVILVLFLFGYYAAGATESWSFPEAAIGGASVAIGYLLVLVPAALLVGFSPPPEALGFGATASGLTISPSLGMTVVLAGGLAAALGAIGGFVRQLRRRS